METKVPKPKAAKSKAAPTARSKGNTANLKPFKPGQSGNPKGRPKGSRDTINEAFLRDLSAAWALHGVDAMNKVATADPATFVRVVASLIPKEVKVDGDVNHKHDHQHRAVSETAGWIAGMLSAGPGRAPQKSVLQ
jgi:hypothetical protein